MKVEIRETYVTAYGGRVGSVTTGHPGDPGSNFGAVNGYPD
jgi:TctA family transporter